MKHKLLQGDNVLDLGCGGGIDIFLAASKIGPLGSAVGLDLSSVCIQLHSAKPLVVKV